MGVVGPQRKKELARKPLSEAAKQAFARSRKLYWIRKKLVAEEKGLKITAPIEPVLGGQQSYRNNQGAKEDPLGEEVFEREMGIGWKRED